MSQQQENMDFIKMSTWKLSQRQISNYYVSALSLSYEKFSCQSNVTNLEMEKVTKATRKEKSKKSILNYINARLSI